VLLAALPLAARAGAAVAEAPRPVDAPQVKELVRAQHGKVVLLSFWATWCVPCLAEFPEIVEIEKSYRDRGVVVISVSADAPRTIESSLVPFLDKNKPGFPVYFMQTDDVEKFLHIIDPEWAGDIPATYFINREGEVASKRFSAMSREEMEQALEALLEKPEP
jgi:thiol-disulfide isomerase/thioredoxin